MVQMIFLKSRPDVGLVLVSGIAAYLRLFDKDVRVLRTESGPVLLDLLHGDQVGGGWGQRAGAAEQRVCWVLPPE